jgi:hypothetical protein
MAKPAAKTTTWRTLIKERDHVAQECLSQKYAERRIEERLAAGDLDWRARAVIPTGYPTDGFWKGSVSIDWADNSARKLIGVDVPMTIAFEYATLVGVEVRRRQATAQALEGKNPPGRSPDVTNRVAAEMVRRFRDGKETVAGLQNATQESLAAGYGASRETVVRAREIALSELSELQSRQFPTRK